ncbi:hypothetical protein IJI31_02915 [bacterium]|nr:hypothetical protein [bacterium]
MKINPVQFNFIQPKPQKTVNRTLLLNNTLTTDTVSFSGVLDIFRGKKTEEPEKTLDDLVPKHKGIIYKKVTDKNGKIVDKVPVEVDIVKKENPKTEPTEFFITKDDQLLGYVKLKYYSEKDCKEDPYRTLCKDFKEEGIKGGRIEVKYIHNFCEDEYAGIGHLADLIEVAACKELGIEPNIVSLSFNNVAPIHYLRGKRFFPYEKYCPDSEMKKHNLYDKNPNDTVREIIENTSKGENFDTSPIKATCLYMYMPKEQVKKLEKELENHPIF